MLQVVLFQPAPLLRLSRILCAPQAAEEAVERLREQPQLPWKPRVSSQEFRFRVSVRSHSLKVSDGGSWECRAAQPAQRCWWEQKQRQRLWGKTTRIVEENHNPVEVTGCKKAPEPGTQPGRRCQTQHEPNSRGQETSGPGKTSSPEQPWVVVGLSRSIQREGTTSVCFPFWCFLSGAEAAALGAGARSKWTNSQSWGL